MNPTEEAIAQALDQCSREPIQIPGSIQPHGFLLALNSAGQVAQVSANAASALEISERIPGSDLQQVLGSESAAILTALSAARLDPGPEYLGTFTTLHGVAYQVIAHRQHGVVILEFETMLTAGPAPSSIFGLIRDFMNQLSPARSSKEMNVIAAREIRTLTGFDRVMIYRFDRDWNGTVVAEDRNDELPSYLGLRFPASDIPAQARELYRVNRLRIIADAGYTAVPIEPLLHPETGQPLDLTYSVLRSVSPLHVQYMRNMGTGASMSISILRDGVLWGLVSCHKKQPYQVPFGVRSACDIIAQVLSSQLAEIDQRADSESTIALKSTQTKLLGFMAEEDRFAEGLLAHPAELLACTNAAGVAVVFDGECRLFGLTPSEEQVDEFIIWFRRREKEDAVFATDSLGLVYEPGKQFSNLASGVIAASISSVHDSYILWFRPELLQTVEWGGNPSKPTEPNSGSGLNPRHSFEVWREQLRGFSQPWRGSEIDSAADFRLAIVRIVLRKAEELAQVSSELKRSNLELEAFSYSVSHDLRAPFRHISGYAELLSESDSATLSDTGRRYLATIVESAKFAGTLVDNLLNFAQIGRSSLHPTDIQVNQLVEEVKTAAMREEQSRQIEWRIGPLPCVRADLFLLRLVFQNLVSNALKYTRPREVALIEITSERREGQTAFTVRDNGVGFDPRYSDKLFGVFQRLHKVEEFEGTGIGLANVQRIVMRHGGSTWAKGAVDQGAAFSFSLPEPAISNSLLESNTK
ncbi:MAG: GAF domain-containing protein [Acidobacteriota bacterium]|nr:GAF domain-containing protein [Acidobacteriota bacterium]